MYHQAMSDSALDMARPKIWRLNHQAYALKLR